MIGTKPLKIDGIMTQKNKLKLAFSKMGPISSIEGIANFSLIFSNDSPPILKMWVPIM